MFHFRSPLLGLAALFFTASTSLAAPAVSLAPVVGPPTSNITVAGTGYGFNKLVEIYFDQANLCLAATTAAGAFSCTIQAPKDAKPQAHWITAFERLTGTAAQKPFTIRTDMAQFHGRNAKHNGVNPFENTLNVNNVGDLDTLWQAPIGASGTSGSAVVAGGNVYVGGLNGKLYAFSATTGATIAGFPVTTGAADNIYSTPAVGGGRVFVGGDDSKLYAYNAATGAAVAGFPKTLGSLVRSAPSLALGNVYVGCFDGKLYAFNATTGAAVAGFPVSTGDAIVASSPTVAGGRVYVGSRDFKIYAFDALTGAAIAGFPLTTGSNVFTTVAAASGMGFAGSGDGKIYGFRLSNGQNLPGFPGVTAAPIISSSAIAGGKNFQGSNDGKLYADLTSGSFAWATALDSEARGSPTVANGVIYTSTISRLYALSAATGAILWSAGVTSNTFNSPVVADSIVYYPSDDGNLYAFSVNGLLPSSRLAGGALGVRPALSMLKPDPSLKPGMQPALTPAAEEAE